MVNWIGRVKNISELSNTKSNMKMANECVRFEFLFSIRFSKLRTKTYKKIDQAKNKAGTYKITTSDRKSKHKIFSTHFIS